MTVLIINHHIQIVSVCDDFPSCSTQTHYGVTRQMICSNLQKLHLLHSQSYGVHLFITITLIVKLLGSDTILSVE